MLIAAVEASASRQAAIKASAATAATQWRCLVSCRLWNQQFALDFVMASLYRELTPLGQFRVGSLWYVGYNTVRTF